jgi:di/tricarboxylate transporter
MDFGQLAALTVLIVVVGALIWGRLRADLVALTAVAALLLTGAIRPAEVQAAFASPALIALASLFVIAYAIERSGLLGFLIRAASRLCARMGASGLWIVIAFCGCVSAIMNNTPIVVLGAPVVRDVATRLGLSPRRFLIPLSYATVLGGTTTLIGTSTNLLVNDMAKNAGLPTIGMFEMTPVAGLMALAGALYLYLAAPRLLSGPAGERPRNADAHEAQTAEIGDPEVYTEHPLNLRNAFASSAVFIAVIAASTFGVVPIAAGAFAGAVLLILLGVITADEAYRGLRPEVLILIAGMVAVGLSLQLTGLANAGAARLVDWLKPYGPLVALTVLYGATLVLTEFLSNAAVAVLMAPVAVALGQSLGVSPRPFVIAIMLAASAAFATPFGYQTNVLVFQLGRYRYLDFVRIGLPLNLITWVVAVATIPVWFPF